MVYIKKSVIRAVRFGYLNKEAHYEYLISFNNLLEKYLKIKALVEEYLPEFLRLLELESTIVDSPKRSPLTIKIRELDDLIDRLIMSINALITSSLRHFNNEVVEAAKILRARMKNFGKITSKSYEGESATIKLLVKDLQGDLVPQVNILGIADRVSELANAESLFTQLFDERNAQIAGHQHIILRDLRILIEPVYRSMIIKINAYITVNNDADYIKFAKEVNEQILYFIEHSNNPKPRIDVKLTIADPVPEQLYTGRPIMLIPAIEYEGKPLVLGADFTVSFKNNTKPGNATLIIHGIGKYKDMKIITFDIVKK